MTSLAKPAGQQVACELQPIRAPNVNREGIPMTSSAKTGQATGLIPVAYLVEFENGERELHFAEDFLPPWGETVTPLYAMPETTPRVAP